MLVLPAVPLEDSVAVLPVDPEPEPVDSEPEDLVAVAARWRTPSPVCPATTTPSLQRCRRPHFFATARRTAATTRTPRPSAKPSTFAPTTVRAAAPSSASSAPMGPCSSSSTLFATGGSMWTVPWRRAFTG